MNNKFEKKYFKEPYRPDENIIREPDSGLTINPYRLMRDEYIELTYPAKLSIISNAILIGFISYLLSVFNRYINNESLKISDQYILISLLGCYGLFRIMDYYFSGKRRIIEKIRDHFDEDSRYIDRQRQRNVDRN
jgi:hypothetical protein